MLPSHFTPILIPPFASSDVLLDGKRIGKNFFVCERIQIQSREWQIMPAGLRTIYFSSVVCVHSAVLLKGLQCMP